MFGFGSSKTSSTEPTTAPTSSITPLSEMGGSNKIKQLKNQVRQEMSVSHAQELVQTMSKHCFEACIASPGDSLTSGQEKCVSQCMGLYTQVLVPNETIPILETDIEQAWSVIQRSYIARVQEEQTKGNL